MQIYSNSPYVASTVPLSLSFSPLSTTRFLDRSITRTKVQKLSVVLGGEGISSFSGVLLKSRWGRRGGGRENAGFFSSVAQARSNRMEQKDGGGWNYDVERDTKFCGGGVIQSVAAPLRTEGIFNRRPREKTRSTEARDIMERERVAFNFDKGANSSPVKFLRDVIRWNINTSKELFFTRFLRWKKRSAQFWVWIFQGVNLNLSFDRHSFYFYPLSIQTR